MTSQNNINFENEIIPKDFITHTLEQCTVDFSMRLFYFHLNHKRYVFDMKDIAEYLNLLSVPLKGQYNEDRHLNNRDILQNVWRFLIEPPSPLPRTTINFTGGSVDVQSIQIYAKQNNLLQ